MDQALKVGPRCLMFFIDETGHEDLSDPNYPVFGMGGCAVMSRVVDQWVRHPWREMKAAHFGGPDVPLHASELRNPTPAQLEALGTFFQTNRFGRFAVTMSSATVFPAGLTPIAAMPHILRKRWQEFLARCPERPDEIALLHEASERGDPLLDRFFGKSVAAWEGEPIPIHHGIVPKTARVEALEVADFIVHAAGGQARAELAGRRDRRRDFQAVFNSGALASVINVDRVE